MAAILASPQALSFTSIHHTCTPRARYSSCKEAASASSHSIDDDDNHGHKFLPSWLETPVDSERYIARRQSHSLRDVQVYLNDWGVEQYPEPTFPDSLDKVTHDAWEAIAGTLYGKQRLDPNVASNAMSRSLYSYRPVRRTEDVGRIGIEIDDAQYLFQPKLGSSGDAIRRVALEIAAKLSVRPWVGFEDDAQVDNNVKNGGEVSSRPVAIYLNTIKQSLIASKELLLLKRIAKDEQTGAASKRYDNITIHCLQQHGHKDDDIIPKHMCRSKPIRNLQKGTVDPKQGIVLVVQPTDYNSEFRPPGPSIGAIDALQQLAARATVQGLPVVLISPRFLEKSTQRWDQSGYQRSSVYGGLEPPKGPTPWLLRDFTPPVFSYIGCALPLSSRHQSRHHIDKHDYPFHYARVVCTQSVMEEGHPFHVFAVKEYDSASTDDKDGTKRITYEYLASTKTSAGRPPREILRHVFDEWRS